MNRIKQLFGIQYPIIQAGMTVQRLGTRECGFQRWRPWHHWRGLHVPRSAARSNPEMQSGHRQPFAVNVPLLYPSIEEHMATIVELGVPVVFTSAATQNWTEHLKSHGIQVVHVVSSVKFALKAQAQASTRWWLKDLRQGAQRGRTTTLCLVPSADALDAGDCGRRYRGCAAT